MTTPISNAQSSFYDPSAQLSSTDGCDSSNASCGPSAEPSSASAREVTIPPVVITGDAGAQRLVKQLDEMRRTPDCSLEAKNAAVSCTKAGLAAAATVLASPSGAGAVIGVGVTFAESVSCGKDLRAYHDCETR
jgi:hypothetical protein